MGVKQYFGLLLFLLLVGCTITGNSVKEEPVKIGVILSLTGTSADAATYVQEGLLLAFNKINAQYPGKYELIFEDSQYDPKIGINAFQKLLNYNGVHYIIGGYSSGVTLAMAPLAEEHKVILITPSAQSNAISTAGDYIFRTQTNALQETEFFAEYLVQKSVLSVNLLVLNSAYGSSFVDTFVPEFERLGGKTNIFEKFDTQETDFRGSLTKIKQTKLRPLILVANRKQAAMIVKQADTLGLDLDYYAPSVIEGQELLDLAGELAEGIVYPYPYDVQSVDVVQSSFRAKYTAKYGMPNEMLSANGYDTLKLLVGCIEKQGDNVDKVKSCLYSIEDYHGASGVLSFDENGDVQKPFIVKIVKDGQFVKVEE